MSLNFKLLHAFLSVAETGSFRKAAEQVHRSQSAVSMQVKQAEEQLGVALFHRTTRRVELTPAGELLLAHAKRAMAEMDNGLRAIKGSVDMQSGQLNLGCVPSVSYSILPSLLAIYMREYPGITVVLRELASVDLLDSISKQDVEFGIGPSVEKANDFQFRHVVDDPIFALMPSDLASRFRNEIALEDLASLPILMYSTAAALRESLEREIALQGIELDIRSEILHTHTLIAFVRAGLGVAILPKIALPSRLGPKLHAVPLVRPTLQRSLDIITLRGQSLSPAAKRLSNLIVQKLRV